MENRVSGWLLYGTYLLAVFVVFLDFLDNLYYYYDLGIYGAMGATLWSVLGAFIAVGCGHKCADFANRIGKSVNFAYAIGFVLGLLGLLIYWLYYKFVKG